MHSLVEELSLLLHSRGFMLVTAESCTGGLIAAAMTDRSGSSAIFERGFITYSNDSKMELLGVPEETLQGFGAVSEQTALAMATGALSNSRAHIALSVTGIAGPTGGSDEKPVGLVWFGIADRGGRTETHRFVFEGDRTTIRQAALETGLELLIGILGKSFA